MTRHLVGLIDGTMVSASEASAYGSYSNVSELAYLLQLREQSEGGGPQIVFYSSGISSRADNRSTVNLLTGRSIWSQIVDQYINICSNFDFDAPQDKPDKIYLFGFSRGAMAVRALASLIAEFGLLRPENIRDLPIILDAWKRTRGKRSLPAAVKVTNAEVEFIGLFDSVMGGVDWLPLFNPISFSNFRLPARCRQAVQILAIDENRRFFKPKFWDGVAKRVRDREFESRRMLKQIWMPGVHSDVGGTGNRYWGNAAFLAMTYYIENYTKLAIHKRTISEKEERFCEDYDNGEFSIDPHRGIGTRFRRSPIESLEAGQGGHPVCDPLNEVSYRGRAPFAWQDEVYNKHFPNVKVDPELKAYFDRILGRGQCATPPVLAVTE